MKTKWENPRANAVIPDLNRWMPWWLLSAIHGMTKTCWAKMVCWRMFGSQNWTQDKDCAIGADGYCYCGKRKGTPE